MTANAIHHAHVPDISNTRSTTRLLTSLENMQRASALCGSRPTLSTPKCTGQIFIGMFFDGTGNNEEADYTSVKGNPDKYKHSNVVRLSHAYPDNVTRGTTKFYRYYIPGVGTRFPEINDDGGKLGTAAAWNGEPRLIWGLTRVFNSVHNYVHRRNLIPDDEAGRLANAIGGLMSWTGRRENAFKVKWAKKLKAAVASKPASRPTPEQINLSVFGFSRGAAQARAFVNWLYAICDEVDGGYQFAGIPLRVEFMGLFDTVTSVGIAGGFTSGPLGMEGRQDWADDNMQIHKGVESCLHIVAAHEVRATFPLDSVRVEGIYPSNVKEYVYPGAHSDVGGGYSRTAQGKTDALARIPCFEMYCAALAAGVPFLSLNQLQKDQRDAYQSLIPSEDACAILRTYCAKAAVPSAPVEEMMRQHMAQYFRYRYQARNDPANTPQGYLKRRFFQKSTAKEKVNLRDTQQHFIGVLAGVSAMLDNAMKSSGRCDIHVPHPYQIGDVPQNVLAWRALVLTDRFDTGTRDQAASKVQEKLPKWRRWLEDNQSPALVDADALERDVLRLIETLDDTPLEPEIVRFFDEWVHDSMAGLAGDGVNEFLLNGIGLAKFRRVYFGDRGDATLREAAKLVNEQRMKAAKAKRAQVAQWRLESQGYARATGRRY